MQIQFVVWANNVSKVITANSLASLELKGNITPKDRFGLVN